MKVTTKNKKTKLKTNKKLKKKIIKKAYENMKKKKNK